MSFILSHTVPIHITAAAGDELTEANKVDGTTKFSVTDTTAFEEQKFVNSDGYSGNTPVWSTLTGSIEGTRIVGSATQAVMFAAFASKSPFYIHVVKNPTGSAGSKGKTYKVYAETDAEDYEAGTSLKFSVPLKFDGGPVAF